MPTPRLPVASSPTIGREADLVRLSEPFEAGARLVTILGPAGMGKTSVALDFGRAQHAAGVRVALCEAASTRDAGTLAAELSATLGADFDPPGTDRSPAQSLARRLTVERVRLLILDNLEQVIEPAAELVAELLAAAPDLRVLATSREPLRVRGESRFELGPLAVPGEGESINESAAVQLFAMRAREVRPDFEVTDGNASQVAEVVRRLDGIPLAIELAAARMGLLSIDALRERLSERLELLSRGRRGDDERQATLRGALDWSWDLLHDAERSALIQCAVFVGPFTPEDAEAVLRVDAPVLELVERLRERSLLRLGGSPPRISFYESIADYAAERLDQSEDRDAVERRHVEWSVAQSEALATEVGTQRDAQARDGLRALLDDSLAAIERALAWTTLDGDVLAARGLVASEPALATRGPFDLHRGLLETVAARASSLPPELLARLLRSLGSQLRQRGRIPEAVEILGDAAIAAKATGDRSLEATIATDLGIALHEHGELERARSHYEIADHLLSDEGSETARARNLGSLAILHQEQGRGPEAEECYERALGLFRDAGDRRSEGIFLCNLGELHREAGHPRVATRHYEQALVLTRDVGDRRVEGVILGNLGGVSQESGHLERANAYRAEAIEILTEVGDSRLVAIFEGYQGTTAHLTGDLTAARAAYLRACSALADAGDRRFEGVFQMCLGSAWRAGDNAGAAERAYAAAADLLRDIDDPALLEALAIHRGERSEPSPLANDEVRFAERLWLDLAEPGSDAALLVGADGRSFRTPDGEKVDLSRRRALRNILAALLDARLLQEPVALSLDDLVAAGWPGERMVPQAASNRTYVAITTLRKLGLRGLLIRRDDGYLLDPSVPCSRVDPPD